MPSVQKRVQRDPKLGQDHRPRQLFEGRYMLMGQGRGMQKRRTASNRNRVTSDGYLTLRVTRAMTPQRIVIEQDIM